MNEQFELRKKTVYSLISDKQYKPMKLKELAILLQVKREDRDELEAVLRSLIEDGKVELSSKGRYHKSEVKKVVGTFTSHPRGFGFVMVEDMPTDIFIGEKDMLGAFHGDLVEVALKGGGVSPREGARPEGQILKILGHTVTTVVGIYQDHATYGFVVPDNPRITTDIFIGQEHKKGASKGMKVVAEIINYGDERHKPEGKIVEILGTMKDPGVDILSMIRAYDLPEVFPEKVLNQAERIAPEVSEADRAGRRDLRGVQMVTIDGEDAKDLDDAVSLTKEGGFFYLGVHIADVSNYVQANSALDHEALKRGNSVYLVDRVIPMLPQRLSNGICSLNAGVDRLALSCLMKIDERGRIVDHEICESVIRVDQRMSYTQVNAILEDKDEALCMIYEKLVPMFEQMGELSKILRENRQKRGAIDFEFPEAKIILDETGTPIEIRPYERNTATKLIEDFMLAANETVAEDYYWQGCPFVYRTHESPDTDRLQKLGVFIRNFGYNIHIGTGEFRPMELQKLLDKVEGTDEEAIISRMTLRSMKQAKYTTDCSGHFGLAAQYYCHFTSPIRRYPDLQIHRIIKDSLRGRLTEEKMQKYALMLPEVARHSSETERKADEAERETDKLKMTQYMERHIGDVFSGVISGVTSFGLFVELPNTVEGMVHVTSMTDEFYEYREQSMELKGTHTGKTYRLGQRVLVRVADTDRLTRSIRFVLIDRDEEFTDYMA